MARRRRHDTAPVWWWRLTAAHGAPRSCSSRVRIRTPPRFAGALHAATLRGDDVMARALLARGGPERAGGKRERGPAQQPRLRSSTIGATPFWLAARFAEPGIMRALADQGADTQHVMDDGTTPLMAATGARRRTEPGLAPNPVENERLVLEAARVAIEAGDDVNAADAEGDSALHTAAARRLESVIQLLADSGADLNARNAEGKTPLMLAGGSDGDDNGTVELLRRLGASGP